MNLKPLKKIKKKLIKYLIEFLIVAFGVFLGIYASERKNESVIKKNKEKTIKNIIQELENNKISLQNSAEYHQMIKVNFDSLKQTIPEEIYVKPYFKNNKFRFNKIKGWTGSQFAELESTAFEAAKMSGTLQNMDIEIIQEVSKIYTKLETLSEFEKSINNRMVNLNFETKTIDVVLSIALITGDNLGMEKNLSLELEKTIEKIKTLHNTVYN